MKRITLQFLLLLIILPAFSKSELLVDAAWLKEHLNDKNLIIFHVGRESVYNEGHIPGALYFSSNEFTYNEGDQVFDLPTDEKLKSLLESKGVTNKSRIIVYTGVNWVPATTRLLFTLHYLGLGENSSVLDGGLMAWKAAEGSLTTEVPTIQSGSLKIKPQTKLLIKKEEVLAALDTKQKIVDCRAAVFYQGIEVSQMHGNRKGHLPGALSIPFTTLYEKTDKGSYEFKSLEALQKIFDGQGLKKDDQIILYCHIGLQLTVIYTASQILGYENVRVYDGSFHEWGADEEMPVE